jgi:chromosome segregation ATPase
VGLAGDVQSNLGAISGLASAAGAGGLGEGVAVGGELFALLEEAPRLKTALSGIPSVAAAATDAVGLGGLTGAVQSAVPALGAGGAALATLGGVGVAAAGALALVNTELQRQKQVAQEAYEATRRNLDLSQQRRREDLTAEQLLQDARAGSAEAYAELVRRQQEASEQIDLIAGDITEATQTLNQAEDVRGGKLLGGGAPEGLRDFAMGGELSRLDSVIQGARDELEELQPSLVEADNSFQAFNDALESIPPAQREALQAQIDAQTESNAALERTGKQYESITARIEQLTGQAADLIETEARNAQREAAIAQLQTEKTLLQQQFNYRDHKQRMIEIERKGNADIEAARDKLASLPGQLTEALASASDEATAELDTLESEYFESRIEATQKFRKRQARVNEDFNRELDRALQDIERSLQDAARDNNVLSFLEAQRRGDTRLSRMQQDANTRQQRDIQDFRDESAARREAFRERRQAIEQNLRDEKQAIRDKFAEERQQIQQTIQEREAALQKELQNVQAAYDQRQRRRERLEAIDQRIADKREMFAQQDLDRRLRNLRTEAAAQNEALADVLAMTRRISREAGRVTAGTPTDSSTSGVSTQTSRLYRDPGTSSRAISAGLESGNSRQGAVQINYSPNVTVGDIASKREVQEALRESERNIVDLTTEFVVGSVERLIYPGAGS